MAPRKKRADPVQNPRDQSLLVKNANIWTNGRFSRGSILIENGKIKKLARNTDLKGFETIDASGLYALPGLIDVHVHLRDMKLAYKEDFATGTAAAAAGGFTTVLDMPNTIPPTDSARRLIEKQNVASRKVHVNIGFHAAARSDPQLIGGLVRAGAFSLKLYIPKPIAPLNVKSNTEVEKMMRGARQEGIPVTVHAEELKDSSHKTHLNSFEELVEARPPLLETRAVERIDLLQKTAGCRVHFCHLTLASSIRAADRLSPRVTTEITPHHLLLSKKILRGLGWKAWMVPPLRSEAERQSLLATMRSGYGDVVASDHAPHAIKEKQDEPRKSPPGVPGLETTLPLMLTLVSRGILSFSRLVSLLAENPARIFGLKTKGKLRHGYDADLVLVDLNEKTRINSARFFSNAKYSPFDGFLTRGAVVSTIVGGISVFQTGDIVAKQGSGSVLRSGFPS